jgi:hypothetical protein
MLKSLTFKFGDRFNIPGIFNEPINIPEDKMIALKNTVNKRYEKYIDDLNDCEAYIEVNVDANGRDIKGWKLKNITDDLADRMNDDPSL